MIVVSALRKIYVRNRIETLALNGIDVLEQLALQECGDFQPTELSGALRRPRPNRRLNPMPGRPASRAGLH